MLTKNDSEKHVECLLKKNVSNFKALVRDNGYIVWFGDRGAWFETLRQVELWAYKCAVPMPARKSKRCGVKLTVGGAVQKLSAAHARELGINLLYAAADADERNREIAA